MCAFNHTWPSVSQFKPPRSRGRPRANQRRAPSLERESSVLGAQPADQRSKHGPSVSRFRPDLRTIRRVIGASECGNVYRIECLVFSLGVAGRNHERPTVGRNRCGVQRPGLFRRHQILQRPILLW